MERHAPSLGDQIARLRGAPAAREKCAWCPAALDALIAAIFARIFGRLEQLLQLWQSGQFPVPPARPTIHANAARPNSAPVPRQSTRHACAPRPYAFCPASARSPTAAQAPGHRPGIAPHHPIAPTLRLHPPRAPPVAKKSRLPKPDRRAIFITIS